MAVKNYRPLTPSLRFTERPMFREITKSKPERSLTEAKKRSGGRNAYGRITRRHQGGGHKQRYRLIDFKRTKRDIAATVEAIEYDPNRSARIALIKYADGDKAYILAPVGLSVGDQVQAGENAEPKPGNSLPLKKIPLSSPIHNIELMPGRGAQLVRSAGSAATLMAVDSGYAQIKLPSTEIRKVHENCYATIGQLGNTDHENYTIGKAGRSRWLGIRPTVRGMVMNPIDHPNGGGQGKSKGGGGRQHLVSPWGQVARGLKTRALAKPSNKFIVQRRKKK
ncbi:MAG: 50S ribosomal protein L2 [Verrucomicrobiae bacterium]|nr:50S ribosomal protein L2 [Verrucomicrobiae bacterium]